MKRCAGRLSLPALLLACLPGCEQLQQACDFTCGKVAEGDVTIAGNAQVDGFFKALYNLQLAAHTVQAQFAADALAIGGAYAVKPEAVTPAFVAKVKAAIDADFQAHLVGGAPQTIFDPPRCHANVEVAVRASAECKVQGGCQASVECKGGELRFQCEGRCDGSCSGECSVPVCELQVTKPQFECTGECVGQCETQVSATCTGTCYGKCAGECSAYDATGNCQGLCAGSCQGTCVASVSGSCGGYCRGRCRVSGPQAKVGCQGELRCEGSCQGQCSGSCQGKITAPRCSLDAQCDAEARCEAQASAQASAELQCRPGRVELRYVFKPGVSVQAKAEFFARLALLEARLASISEGFARFDVFLKGDAVAGVKPVFPELAAEVGKILATVVSGKVKLAPIRLTCVEPALREAASILGAVPAQLETTYTMQLSMLGIAGYKKTGS
ncbi:MAG: hypothetical protein IT371_21435 [Deltaproteobacteria bacterium]|nr:hypothetical protein [Deltaproteobacteria bacterium]